MQDREPEEFRTSATMTDLWYAFRRSRIALFSLYAFILFILTALFGPLIAPYSSDMQFVGKELMPPSWFGNGQVAYFFGTDDIGRDVLSRMITGFRYTFGGAVIVVLFTAVIGGVLGIVTGMGRGARSQMVGHFLDAFLSTPILLIAIIIATLMQPNLINAMLAIFLALLPHFVHEIYQAIQRELSKEYVMMLRLDGATDMDLLKEAVLPNIVIPYIKEISRAFAIAILDISALSFISLGAQSPLPEWGAMLRDYIPLIYLAPWTVFLPGIAIIAAILVVIVLGNALCRTINQYYE